MPQPISRQRVIEFQRAFSGEVDSLAALYRNAAADMLDILADAAALSGQRARAAALLHQYQAVLADLNEEAAAWIELNVPRAYGAGLEFVDGCIADYRRAGVNLRDVGGRVTGRTEPAVFAQVHREAVRAVTDVMLDVMSKAALEIGRRVDDVFRREGLLAVARGIVEGQTRAEVSRALEQRLLELGRPDFIDKRGRHWPLDRYTEMVARTTTREAMTRGTIQRLREHGVELAQVSAHNAQDFCIFYENAIVCVGDQPHHLYPPIAAIDGGPPFHPRCVHVLTPFVEWLATEEEKKAGIMPPEVLGRPPAELQRAQSGRRL
ncbi:MAG: phage minor capsid protein [Armatimonadota bacterium]